MGRYRKTGLAYYNSDTDRYGDLRIKKLIRSTGTNGIAIYDYILNEIYRNEGYYLDWDESVLFDVAHYFNVKESLVTEVVNQCCSVGLFHKGVLENAGVLTSASIQLRYFTICELIRRKAPAIPPDIKLSYLEPIISSEEMTETPPVLPISSEEITKKGGVDDISSEEMTRNQHLSTQIKEKKRKEKEIEEKAAVHKKFIEELLADVRWCQERSMQYSLPDDGFKILRGWLEKFDIEIRGKMKFKTTLEEFAEYFFNWMNRQGLNNKKPGNDIITYVDGQAVKGNIHGHATNY